MIFKFAKIKRKRSGGEGESSEAPRRSWSTIFILLLSLILGISLLFNFFQFKQQPSPQIVALEVKKALAEPREPLAASSEISGHWYGLCPKNSIHSIEDFKRQVENDPLLKRHFSDFNWEKARIGQHKNEIYTHVTFRKNGVIGVTRKRVKLPAGDRFITDENRWVRLYCGNDYVQAGGESTERIDTDLNRLIERAENTSQGKKSGMSGGEEEAPVVVPESGTLLLFGAGLGCLGLMSLLRKSKSRRRRVTHRNKAS